MPITIGKKQRYAEINAFGKRPVKPIAPKTTIIIGAIARIGIVCEAIIQGNTLLFSVGTCTIPMASNIPKTPPITKPTIVEEIVTQP
jgi:hypothetical protein